MLTYTNSLNISGAVRRSGLFCLIWIVSSFSGAIAQTYTSYGCVKVLKGDTRKNSFKKTRGLGDYLDHAGPLLVRDLMRLGGEAHVIDGGAGEAQAMADLLSPFLEEVDVEARWARYRSMFPTNPEIPDAVEASEKIQMAICNRPLEDKPRVTAISYKVQSRRGLPPRSRFNLLTGRYFEDLSNEEILGDFGKADLIIDHFGIFSYGRNPGTILRRYFALLKEGGAIYLHVGHPDFDNHSSLFNHTVRVDDRQINLVQWLKRIPGLRVQENVSSEGYVTLRLSRKRGQTVAVPRLRLNSVTRDFTHQPRPRHYRQLD